MGNNKMINKDALWDAETLGLTHREVDKTSHGKVATLVAIIVVSAFLAEWIYLMIMLNEYIS